MKKYFLMVLMTMMAVGLTNCNLFGGGDEGSSDGGDGEQKVVAVYSVLPAPPPGLSKSSCLKKAEIKELKAEIKELKAEIKELYNFTGDEVTACHSATAESCEKAKADWTTAQTEKGFTCSSASADKNIEANTTAGEVRPCGTLKVEIITCVKTEESAE